MDGLGPGGTSQGEPPTKAVRIVLADDHHIMRRGLAMLISREPEFDIVAQAGDVASAKREVLAHRPDVLLLDLNMPGGSVLDAIPQLRNEAPQTQIVMITMQQEGAMAIAAMEAGAAGYVPKDAADDELFEAIRRVAAGGRYIPRGVAGRIAQERIRTGGWD
jgi:two-component system response regulator NreC